MAVVTVVHKDGRTARMTTGRLAKVADQGWRPLDPTKVIETSTDDNIDTILGEVGDDPVKAQAALAIERDGKNRSTLVSKLEAITKSDQ